MANARTGRAKGESGRPGQLPWQQDPEILQRIRRVVELRSNGRTLAEVAAELDVSLETAKADWARLKELRKEEAVDALEQHIETLQRLKAQLHAELDRLVVYTDREGDERVSDRQERARIYESIRKVEMDIARLDGSLVERKELTGKDGAPLTFTLEIPKPAAAGKE